MPSVEFKNHEEMHGKLMELEKIKLGTEVPIGQMLKAIHFKAKWVFDKKILLYNAKDISRI